MKTALLTLALALSSYQSIADGKAEKAAIDYRKSTFKMVKWHMGPMAGMVKGKIPYDAAAFSSHATDMAALSLLAPNGFVLKSPSPDSRSKASIWENKADFDKKMDAFKEAAATLATTAKSNDIAAIKPAFGALGKSCKSCHNDYRLEKK